jgi:hypothetical protein
MINSRYLRLFGVLVTCLITFSTLAKTTETEKPAEASDVANDYADSSASDKKSSKSSEKKAVAKEKTSGKKSASPKSKATTPAKAASSKSGGISISNYSFQDDQGSKQGNANQEPTEKLVFESEDDYWEDYFGGEDEYDDYSDSASIYAEE